MAVYEYTAKDDHGDKFSSVYDNIDNVVTLQKDLDKAGYVLLDAQRKRDMEANRRKIKPHEVVTFAFKFAGMYSAGLSILQSLEMLEEQATNEYFKVVITDIRQNIETGSSLKKAFSKYRNIFTDFFVGMVEAGEASGKLADTLEMSAVYLEKRMDMKRKIKAAFAYPIVVSCLCFAVIGFLLVYFIPVFSKLYRQLKVPLPGPTQFLVSLSLVVRDYWFVIVLVGFILAVVIRRLLKNRYIRGRWDVFKLYMPVFGKLNRMVVTTNFVRAFATLASVGVPLTKALEVAGTVAQNSRIAEISGELQRAIESGSSVAKSLKRYKVFPAIIPQLAASGEKSGKLAEMLDKGAEFLDKDTEKMIRTMLVKLEPLLTVIMGFVVGFVLMSVYLPMFDYMSHLK